MLQLSEQNKKYIFMGIAILLFILFLLNNKSVSKKKTTCCGEDMEELKNIYNNNPSITTIMNFNTDWCGYSKQFQPIWNQFSSNMTGKGIKVQNIKCDKEENAELCQKFKVQGYPTVKLIKDNKEIEYNGDRTVEDLEDFANQHI